MSSDPFIIYDPSAPDFADRAHTVYDRLRTEEPWHWAPKVREWIVTRHADAKVVLRHPALMPFDMCARVEFAERESGQPLPALWQLAREMVFFQSGPAHMQARRFLGRVLNQQPVAALKPAIEGIVTELSDALRRAGGGDLVSGFARRLPLRVMGGLLGVPEAEMEFLTACAEEVTEVFERGLNLKRFVELNSQVAMAFDLLAGLCAERRASPRDDGLSRMLDQARLEAGLDERVVVARAFFLFVVGLDTTATFLSRSIRALLAEAGERERWRDGCVSDETAVEELLRYTSAVALVSREAVGDIEMGGHVVARGQLVTVLLEAVNRDPAVFADPHRLDLGRSPCPHLVFGDGVHACLGASLARLSGVLALREFVRLPSMRVIRCADAGWRQVLRPTSHFEVVFE